jgi:hypothetical protein
MKHIVEHSGFRIVENFLDHENLYCVGLMVANN